MTSALQIGDACEYKPATGLGGWRAGVVEALVESYPGGPVLYRVAPVGRGPALDVAQSRVRPAAEPKIARPAPAAASAPARQPVALAAPYGAPPVKLTPGTPVGLRAAPARDSGFLAHVRGLACAGCYAYPPNEAHHFGPRGMGQKTDDYRTLPLCRTCHDHWHAKGVLPGCGTRAQSEAVAYRAQVDALVSWLRKV